MNQPLVSRRPAWPAEDILDMSDDVLDVDKMADLIGELSKQADYRPTDDVAKALYALFQYNRAVIDWLLDLTLRAPYPHVDGDFQKAALAAAKHQARAGIGEVIAAAIAEGKRISDQQKDQ